jgi:hypothetical protein
VSEGEYPAAKVTEARKYNRGRRRKCAVLLGDNIMNNDYDDISKFDNHETANKLPLGWLVMAVCLMVFSLYYIFAYTPAFTGWQQTDQYEEAVKVGE